MYGTVGLVVNLAGVDRVLIPGGTGIHKLDLLRGSIDTRRGPAGRPGPGRCGMQ